MIRRNTQVKMELLHKKRKKEINKEEKRQKTICQRKKIFQAISLTHYSPAYFQPYFEIPGLYVVVSPCQPERRSILPCKPSTNAFTCERDRKSSPSFPSLLSASLCEGHLEIAFQRAKQPSRFSMSFSQVLLLSLKPPLILSFSFSVLSFL